MISKEWLKRQSQFFLDNSEVSDITRKVYHISLDPVLKSLTPRIAHSQTDSEDRSVPRICASLSVADAIYGYGRLLSASFSGGHGNETTRANKDPVFHIYSKTVNGCIFPKEALCGDAVQSGEVWLVADKAANTSVTFNKEGEFFISNTSYSYGVDAKEPLTEVLIQVRKEGRVHLEKDVVLQAGWYKATAADSLNGVGANGERARFTYTKITRAHYTDAKAAIKKIYSEG